MATQQTEVMCGAQVTYLKHGLAVTPHTRLSSCHISVSEYWAASLQWQHMLQFTHAAAISRTQQQHALRFALSPQLLVPQHKTKTNKRAVQTHLLKYAWTVCCRNQVAAGKLTGERQLSDWGMTGEQTAGQLQLHSSAYLAFYLSIGHPHTAGHVMRCNRCARCLEWVLASAFVPISLDSSISVRRVSSAAYWFKMSLWWGRAAEVTLVLGKTREKKLK